MNRFRDRPRSPAGTSGPSQDSPDRVEQLWPGYLRDGYFDANGNLRVEYVSRERVEPLAQAMAGARPPLTTNQLRRFFQHCRRLESCLKSGSQTWGQVRPQVLFLDAAAQDAHGKSPKKIPGLFFDFIRRNVGAIGNQRDFLDGFLPHFEALVGFGSGYIRREGN
jgi:CRISPR type III-A-associated protein Csm2